MGKISKLQLNIQLQLISNLFVELTVDLCPDFQKVNTIVWSIII